MRMSCNGCRVLRKGCNDDCILRPCLEWIKSPESQANATIFLAKFYGRAGLVNLITAAPLQHRTAIFRSLLYEACGRIINPIYGAVGLMWSGSWEQCRSAVESVLDGSAIIQLPSDHSSMALKGNYDIRHLNRGNGVQSKGLKRNSSRGTRSKSTRVTEHWTSTITTDNPEEPVAKFSISGWNWEDQRGTSTTHDHDHDQQQIICISDHESGSFDRTTMEPTSVHQAEETSTSENCEDHLLDLTLGWHSHLS